MYVCYVRYKVQEVKNYSDNDDDNKNGMIKVGELKGKGILNYLMLWLIFIVVQSIDLEN